VWQLLNICNIEDKGPLCEFENLEQVQMSNCRKGSEPLDWLKTALIATDDRY
jgi:hypothetical protein